MLAGSGISGIVYFELFQLSLSRFPSLYCRLAEQAAAVHSLEFGMLLTEFIASAVPLPTSTLASRMVLWPLSRIASNMHSILVLVTMSSCGSDFNGIERETKKDYKDRAAVTSTG